MCSVCIYILDWKIDLPPHFLKIDKEEQCKFLKQTRKHAETFGSVANVEDVIWDLAITKAGSTWIGNMASEFWPQSSVPYLKGCGWGPNPSPGKYNFYILKIKFQNDKLYNVLN